MNCESEKQASPDSPSAPKLGVVGALGEGK